MNKEIMKKVANIKHDVELKSEKVELGVVQDMKKEAKRGEAIIKATMEQVERVETATKELKSLAKLSNDYINIMATTFNNADDIAKDLGVSVTDIPEQKIHDQVYNNLRKANKFANEAIK
jgi:uncharacterized protein YoxC